MAPPCRKICCALEMKAAIVGPLTLATSIYFFARASGFVLAPSLAIEVRKKKGNTKTCFGPPASRLTATTVDTTRLT